MTYVKTQHLQGHGWLIIHTPCHSVSRLVIFILSVLYPVAAKLSCFIMEVSQARSYLSYLFVHHGIVLSSPKFSNILRHYTEKHLGISLGLRDYRQIMCSMLCCLAGTDYGASDDNDHDLAAIHGQFGHSASIANTHYGIQGTNTLSIVSHTSVRSMQRVSAHWHACLGCSRTHIQENEQRPSEEDQPMQLWSKLKIPLESCIQDANCEAIQDVFNRVLPHWTGILQSFGSDLTSYINTTFFGQSAIASSRLLPLVIHPMLASQIHPLYPGPEEFSFKSHHQAELVQSCFTNEHVLAVMPTGSGKSLAFFAAPLLNTYV